MTDEQIRIEITTETNKAKVEIDALNKKLKTLEREISKVGDKRAKVDQLTRSFRQLTVHVGKLAIIYGSFHSLVGAIKTTADFEQAIKRLGITSNSSAEDIKLLEDMAKALGESTVFSASQVAGAMNEMALGGLTAKEQLAGVDDVLNLAAVGLIDLGEATQISVTAMKSWGLEASQLNDVSDILAKGASISATNITQLGQALAKVGTVAKNYNVTLEETTAALGVLADSGRRGAEAGTQLKIVMSRLAGNKEAKKYLDELGISMYDANHNLIPFNEQIKLLRDRLQKLPPDVRAIKLSEIGGEEAKASLIALMENLDKFDNKLKKIKQAMSDDYAKQAAKDMMDTLSGSYKSLLSALEGLAIKIGQVLIPLLTDSTRSLTEFVRGLDEDKVRQFAEGIGGLISLLSDFLSIAAKISGTMLELILENQELLKLIAELAIGIKAYIVVNNALIASNGKLRVSFVNAATGLKTMSKTLYAFAAANPIIAAFVAASAAIALYLDHLEEVNRVNKKMSDDMVKQQTRYEKLTSFVEESYDRERKALVLTNEEKSEYIKLIGNEINSIEKKLEVQRKDGEDLDTYRLKQDMLKRQKESLILVYEATAKAIDKESLAVKKAQIEWEKYGIVTPEAEKAFKKIEKLYDKRLAKANKTIEKLIKSEQKFNVEISGLALKRLEIENTYANKRIDVNDKYEQKLYDLSLKGLKDYEKYKKNLTRIDELERKAQEAMRSGDFDHAKSYYASMESLADSFAETEISKDGRVLASKDQTRSKALEIYERTKNGEMQILLEQEIAELKAHDAKMEMKIAELEMTKAQIQATKAYISALKSTYQDAQKRKGEFADTKELDKTLGKLDEIGKKFKDKRATLQYDINERETKLKLMEIDRKAEEITNKDRKLHINTADIERGKAELDQFRVGLDRLSMNGYTVRVDADTTPADFNITKFTYKWDGHKLTQIVNPEWKQAERVLESFRMNEAKKPVQQTVKADTKPATIDINRWKSTQYNKPVTTQLRSDTNPARRDVNKFDKDVSRLKPQTQPVYSDMSNVVESVNLTMGWIASLSPSLNVYADVNNVYRPVIDAINWINSQVAYIDVYTRYHNAGGGYIPKLATGGYFSGDGLVGGYDPTDSDKVSAMLTGGEYVIKRESVDTYGLGLLTAINQMQFAKPKGYATGGHVGSDSSDSSSGLQPINLTIGGSSYSMFSDADVAEALVRNLKTTGGL